MFSCWISTKAQCSTSRFERLMHSEKLFFLIPCSDGLGHGIHHSAGVRGGLSFKVQLFVSAIYFFRLCKLDQTSSLNAVCRINKSFQWDFFLLFLLFLSLFLWLSVIIIIIISIITCVPHNQYFNCPAGYQLSQHRLQLLQVSHPILPLWCHHSQSPV